MSKFIVVRNGEVQFASDSYDKSVQVAIDDVTDTGEPSCIYELVASLQREVTVKVVEQKPTPNRTMEDYLYAPGTK